MQQTMQRKRQFTTAPLQFATSQRDTAIQLGLSHIIAAGAALGMYFWLNLLHVQQPYTLLITLAIACVIGLGCTLNLQYGLYLLELTLSHLAHDRLTATNDHSDYKKYLMRRWPLVPLFTRLQEAAQLIRQYATNEQLTTDLRAKTLQQAGETAAQAERNRIARELHDSIKQQIFSISMSAAAAKAHWQSADGGDAREAVEDIQRSAKEAQVEMQALLQQLRPAPLENTSLVDALRIQAQALGFRTGAQVHVEIGELPGNERLLPGTQEAIFRLVQEAFANIAKHARAQTVWLTLRNEEQTLRIVVRDDGQGFASEHASAGMGLNNLRERSQELHGQAEISSRPGQGTSVTITIPLLNALSSPEEETRRQYELTRATELSRWGYQLAENTALLGMALVALASLINVHWSIVVLGVLVSGYGYVSGNYYRIQVALHAGRDSKGALELKQQQYRALINLTRLLGFVVWYGFTHLDGQHLAFRWELLAGMLIVLTAGLQIARRRHYLGTERFYALLSSQELLWELDRRQQGVIRSLTFWFIACVAGLITSRALLVPPPLSIEQQTAYGVAIILLLMGIGLFSDYFQIQRWRQTFSQRKQSADTGAQEK
jgi:signal transduction histidine kinase